MHKLRGKKVRLGGSAVSKQRGVVVPIVVIGLIAILAVAGLALDGSHALGNKTRMQNVADAAALGAAKVLDDTDGDTILATAAANSLFSINASSPGNHEMNDAYGAGDISVTVQYSLTLNPFVPGSFVHGSIPLNNEWWVRVIATGFDTPTTLSRVLGIDEIPTPATAVAGPSGPLGSGGGAQICDVAPIAVCEDAVPTNEQDVLRVLIPKPGDSSAIGPGNYKLLRLHNEDGTICNPSAAGGDCLKKNLAGAADTCVEIGGGVETENDEDSQPGQLIGPVSQGFNTRFDDVKGGLSAPPYFPDRYIDEQGNDKLKSCAPKNDPTASYIFLTNDNGNNFCNGFPDDYDRDTDTLPEKFAQDLVETADEINYNYCNYIGDTFCEGQGPSGPGGGPKNNPPGEKNRRLLQFPIVTCDSMTTGTGPLTVSGVACFFMLQSLAGNAAGGNGEIFGQYVDTCPANGNSGSNPGGGPGGPLLYKIQLYKDPDSTDS